MDIALFFQILNRLSGSFTAKGFNFAKSSATSNDLEEQARDLLRAMESDQRIDMNTFWKVSAFVIYLLRSLNIPHYYTLPAGDSECGQQ